MSTDTPRSAPDPAAGAADVVLAARLWAVDPTDENAAALAFVALRHMAQEHAAECARLRHMALEADRQRDAAQLEAGALASAAQDLADAKARLEADLRAARQEIDRLQAIAPAPEDDTPAWRKPR